MATSPESLRPENSPASERFSTAPTVTDSARSKPTCLSCLEIYRTLSEDEKEKWPPTKNLELPCHGWPGLANLMVKKPGFESFQAFRDLHIKSLLYYQAELVKIREDLHKLEWKNHTNGGFGLSDKLSERVDFLLKTESDFNAGDEGSEQMLKIRKMRTVLKEYSEAMLLYTKINDLPEPETFSVNNLLKLLKLKRRPINGPGEDSWGKLKAHDEKATPLGSQFWRLVRAIFWEKECDKVHLDLVVPRKNKEMDGFTRWVYSEGVPFWERLCVEWNDFWKRPGRLPPPSPDLSSRRSSNASIATFVQWLSDIRRKWSNASQESEKSEDVVEEKTKIVTYPIKRLIAFTTFVTTVVSSLLPIVAIVVLSKMHEQPMILGFIALFTGLFTMGLMILTPSGTSRTEIFTASAAFSAVMVVFVQNQSGGNGS